MDHKPLPVGVDHFEKLVTRGYYYLDKTWFIKELLDKKGDVNLFTRPRRFGKTLNMSMLQYFFEDMRTDSGEKKDNADYGSGGRISCAHGAISGDQPDIKERKTAGFCVCIRGGWGWIFS